MTLRFRSRFARRRPRLRLEPLEDRRLLAATDVRLDVNLASGETQLVFNGAQQISAYQIDSPNGQLLPGNWQTLSSQGHSGWFTLGNSATTIAEGSFGSLTASAPISLGRLFTANGEPDLTFRWADANNMLFVSTVTYIAQSPDLTISKSHVGSFRQGDANADYTIDVSNVGSGESSGTVTVTDTLPAGLTPTSASGLGWTTQIVGSTVTATRNDALGVSAAYPRLVISVSVADDAAASVTNLATVAGGGDLNAANNSASDPTTIVQAADLIISKSHLGAFHLGDLADEYRIVVRNEGAGSTIGAVTVSDPLPTGLLPTAASGVGWITQIVGSTVTATRDDVLGPGASYPPLVITVRVADDAPANVINTAAVSGGGERITANNTASDPTAIDAEAPDLAVAKSHVGSFRQGDPADQYAIVVRNIGSLATSGQVTLTDILPLGLTPTAASGDGWEVQIDGGVVVAQRSDSLPSAGEFPPLTITVRVANDAPANVVNTVVVAGGGQRNTANDSSSDATAIAQAADLTIGKSHSGVFRQGDEADLYTLVVHNGGAGPTVGLVTVTDVLPLGLIPTAGSGVGWQVQIDGATVTATRSDALAAGADYPALSITVRVASDAVSVINTAAVAGGGELNTLNNSATDPTSIEVRSPDLTVAKSHSGAFRQGDAADQYALVASNVGFAATKGPVTVIDTLPTGLTPVSAAGDGWQVQVDGRVVTATRSDSLAVNASYPEIRIVVAVAADAASSLTNSATVSGGGELNTANNVATDVTLIEQVADLTISKSARGPFRQGDLAAAYQIRVGNVGPGPTVGAVTVTDVLPAGLVPTVASGDGWQVQIVGSTVSATRDDALSSGSDYPVLTVTVRVANDAPASVVNAATVAGGGELNAANDSASEQTTVIQVADLTIAKSHVGAFRQGDADDAFAILVQNVGPGPSDGSVIVTDALPAGFIPLNASGDGWQVQISGATVTATRSDALGSGAAYPALTIAVRVADDAPASIANTATVAGGGELNAANNSATDLVSVVQAADLTIQKSHRVAFEQGEFDATYTILVTNAGAGATVGEVTVTDALPAGLALAAASGDGWQVQIVGMSVVAKRSDPLAPSESYPELSIIVRVDDDAPANLSNTVTVAGGGELNPANSSASDPTIIAPGAASLSGYAYIDADNDGRRVTPAGRTSVALPNIEIRLLRKNFDGEWIEVPGQSPSLTRFDGRYTMTGLSAGDYRLHAVLPDTLLDGRETPGTIAGVVRGTAGGDRIEVRLNSGEAGADYNFGALGIEPNWLSLRLLLSSTPPADEVVSALLGPVAPTSLQVAPALAAQAAFRLSTPPPPANLRVDASLVDLLDGQAAASLSAAKKKTPSPLSIEPIEPIEPIGLVEKIEAIDLALAEFAAGYEA